MPASLGGGTRALGREVDICALGDIGLRVSHDETLERVMISNARSCVRGHARRMWSSNAEDNTVTAQPNVRKAVHCGERGVQSSTLHEI